MAMRTVRSLVFVALLLWAAPGLAAGSPPAKKPARHVSPPYTVMVALEMSSSFVPDGRMSFADLAFSATFKDVVFVIDLGAGEQYAFFEKHDGKLFLTRVEFNDVAGPDERHRPWVEKPWPKEFSASLVEGWIERDEDEGQVDADGIPLVPLVPETIKLGFYARFGLLDLEWFSKLGSNVLSNMLFEFEVPWRQLVDGKPVSLKIPFEPDYPEDKGMWWIEFIPQKK